MQSKLQVRQFLLFFQEVDIFGLSTFGEATFAMSPFRNLLDWLDWIESWIYIWKFIGSIKIKEHLKCKRGLWKRKWRITLRYDLNRFLKVLFAPTQLSLLMGCWQITSSIQQSLESVIYQNRSIPLEFFERKLYYYCREKTNKSFVCVKT